MMSVVHVCFWPGHLVTSPALRAGDHMHESWVAIGVFILRRETFGSDLWLRGVAAERMAQGGQ